MDAAGAKWRMVVFSSILYVFTDLAPMPRHSENNPNIATWLPLRMLAMRVIMTAA